MMANSALGGAFVALCFQERDDIDREVSKKRSYALRWVLGLSLALTLLGTVLPTGIGRPIAESLAAVFLALWALSFFVEPFYYEFRIRTKEIYGTVTEIEKAVSAVKADHKELLERLSAIEDELHSLRETNDEN